MTDARQFCINKRMRTIGPTGLKILALIQDARDRELPPPSVQEMIDVLGLRGKSNIFTQIQRFVRYGLVTKVPNAQRTLVPKYRIEMFQEDVL